MWYELDECSECGLELVTVKEQSCGKCLECLHVTDKVLKFEYAGEYE